MVENSKQFPHVRLKLARQGSAKTAKGGGSNKLNPTTASNQENRWGHGNKLKSSVDSIVID